MAPKSNPHSSFRRRLAAWFRASGRDLPWRRTRDAYAIVVSEFMLQQTQVSRVLDYYPRFLKRYPTVGDLARARPSAVRESWQGLGYYRRAANLHAMAKVVVRDHGGELPPNVAELRKLPGIGQYTAGAVACFAYERAEATVDTNVGRVLERYFHKTVRGGPGRSRTVKSKGRMLQELAMSIQPRNGAAAWTFNQALMELGALVCTARSPKCRDCPVARDCTWSSKQA
jgi:A/G-specific adenine glycosylase